MKFSVDVERRSMMIPLPMILVYQDRETRRVDEGVVRIIMPYGEDGNK